MQGFSRAIGCLPVLVCLALLHCGCSHLDQPGRVQRGTRRKPQPWKCLLFFCAFVSRFSERRGWRRRFRGRVVCRLLRRLCFRRRAVPTPLPPPVPRQSMRQPSTRRYFRVYLCVCVCVCLHVPYRCYFAYCISWLNGGTPFGLNYNLSSGVALFQAVA